MKIYIMKISDWVRLLGEREDCCRLVATYVTALSHMANNSCLSSNNSCYSNLPSLASVVLSTLLYFLYLCLV